ncbi:hypothetical protein SLA2020_513900 [Shorea laevis]
MIEKGKSKKCSISEEDIANLLQRYTATTLLALLQEVAHSAKVKLNWKELVKKTSTGISNAREYQMLWRHLAYREGLAEKFEDGAEPLEDDSDLECELQPFPSVSNEASAEAAACVKVMIASGLPSNSSIRNSSTVEAPLTINIPNVQTCRASSESSQSACSMRGINITVPVSIQKNITLNDSLDGNGAERGNNPRKRKKWSPAEDQELIAAVNKHGAGNWASILREDCMGGRTASQLSQRYKNLIKKQGNANLEEKPTMPQLTEAQLATRSALSLALDRPKQNLMAACTRRPALKTTPSTSELPPATTAGTSDQAQNQRQRGSITAKSSPVEPEAAGAHIGSPETAASLFKPAKANNAIYVMSSGGSSIKPHVPGGAFSQQEVHPKAASVRAGQSVEPLPTSSHVTSAPHSSAKSFPPLVRNTPPASASSLNISSQQCNAIASGPAAECEPKQELEATKEIKGPNLISGSGSVSKEQVQQNGKCISTDELDEGVKGHKANLEPEVKNMNIAQHPNENPSACATEKNQNAHQLDIAEHPHKKLVDGNKNVDLTGCTAEKNQNACDGEMRCSAVREGSTKSTAEPRFENSSVVGKQAESSSNREALSKSEASTTS